MILAFAFLSMLKKPMPPPPLSILHSLQSLFLFVNTIYPSVFGSFFIIISPNEWHMPFCIVLVYFFGHSGQDSSLLISFNVLTTFFLTKSSTPLVHSLAFLPLLRRLILASLSSLKFSHPTLHFFFISH